MTRRPSPKWITEAVNATREAGVTVGTVEITDRGVVVHAPGAYTPADAFGEWKRGRKSQGRAHSPKKAE